MMKINEIIPHLNIISTRKYKDINIYLRFSINNDIDTLANVSVLTKLLDEYSNKYPTKLLMTKAKDMLYGFNCSSQIKNRGNLLTLGINMSFINPKFLNTNINEYLQFIDEILFNCYFNETLVNEAKRIVSSILLRSLEKPEVLASQKVLKIISKDNKQFKYLLNDDTYLKAINNVTVNSVLNVYKKLLSKAQLEVYLVGDLDIALINYFKKYNYSNKCNLKYLKCNYLYRNKVVEKKDISQSYLSVLYKTPYNRNHSDFYAFVLGNAFLGIYPTSLLFNEIRENMSLCYNVSVLDYKNYGLVKINTSIDGKNMNVVIKEIDKQINRLINKDYDIKQFERTKKLFINTLISIDDDLLALIEYDLETKLSKNIVSIKEYCNGIRSVTVDDIARVFKNYKPYFVYMLKGTSHEEVL